MFCVKLYLCTILQNVWEIQKKTQWQITRTITWLLQFNIRWCVVVVVVIVLKDLYEAWKDLEEECCPARKILIIKAISQEQMAEEMFVWRLFFACRILVALKMSAIPYLVSLINSLPSSLWHSLKLILGLTWHLHQEQQMWKDLALLKTQLR